MQNPLDSRTELLVATGLLLATLLYSVRACAADAKRRGRSPVLVAALVTLLFPFGMIIWLAVRPKLIEGSN
jgi:hypothetical protein